MRYTKEMFNDKIKPWKACYTEAFEKLKATKTCELDKLNSLCREVKDFKQELQDELQKISDNTSTDYKELFSRYEDAYTLETKITSLMLSSVIIAKSYKTIRKS